MGRFESEIPGCHRALKVSIALDISDFDTVWGKASFFLPAWHGLFSFIGAPGFLQKGFLLTSLQDHLLCLLLQDPLETQNMAIAPRALCLPCGTCSWSYTCSKYIPAGREGCTDERED